MTGKIEVIEWIDPCMFRGGWIDKDDFLAYANNGEMLVTSVGFVFFENEEAVTLVQSASSFDSVTECTRIAKSSIKRRTPIGVWESLTRFEAWAGDNAPKWDGVEFNESGAPIDKF